jgi:predicted secreted hydrolase
MEWFMNTNMRRFISFLIFFGALTAVGVWWWSTQSTTAVADTTLTTYLIDDGQQGFAQATEPGNVRFPEDLGPHNDFQTEWWYYTGNLKAEDGRDFGYQFTIFRRALTPELAESTSDWRSNQVYFAHFAISDIANDDFYYFEKFSRGSLGLAGAQAVPYQVWIEDWSVEEQVDGTVQMRAAQDGIALDLNLTQTKAPVLQGDRGLSAKGSTPGNASYYYSLVNQRSEGTITIGEEIIAVTGHSWKDHEYSTSALEIGATGWDWFSLQFDNADENALMLFQIRRDDGTLQAESGGSWILPDSSVEKITLEDMQIEVLDTWTSPHNGAEYPSSWRIQIPKIGLDITGEALMADQELNLSTTYWEGAVRFSGTLDGEPISATGYVEMTGYSGSMAGRI